MSSSAPDDHDEVMRRALHLAKSSPLRPSNFRVGAVLVKLDGNGTIASEGYTLECPGNTHAEECCLLKLAKHYSTTEEGLAHAIHDPHALYTTLEPCSKRLSGKLSCVERLLRQKSWIRHVFIGLHEPNTFVAENLGLQMLEEGGIKVHHVPGLEKEILKVAVAGHTDDPQPSLT